MKIFDRIVAASLPYVPRAMVRSVANSYIAGDNLANAVQTVKNLNQEGAMATLDVLGEDTTEEVQTLETVGEYERALSAITEQGLDCNVSIKLTALGLMIDDGLCRENLVRVLKAAQASNTFVRIDMEDSSTTTRTLELYRDVHREFDNVGPVLQSYMRRSMDDARELADDPALNLRICKGIYNESEEIAFKDRDEIRHSYVSLVRWLLEKGAYLGIATHDSFLLDEARRLITDSGLGRDRYEFQMLLGVTPRQRKELIAEGHRLRVYVPYGANWYGYSIRRLRENPQIAGYVAKGLLLGKG